MRQLVAVVIVLACAVLTGTFACGYSFGYRQGVYDSTPQVRS